MARAADIGNRGEVAEAVRHAAAKLSQDLSRTARDAQSAAAEFATAVQHEAEDLGERTIEFGEQAARRARGASRAVQENVREHPITWVAAAAGAGAILGLLLARRR